MNKVELARLLKKYLEECNEDENVDIRHLESFLIDNVFPELKQKEHVPHTKEEIFEDDPDKNHCYDCYWFNGDKGDGFQFCDKKEIEVHENSCCCYFKTTKWF